MPTFPRPYRWGYVLGVIVLVLAIVAERAAQDLAQPLFLGSAALFVLSAGWQFIRFRSAIPHHALEHLYFLHRFRPEVSLIDDLIRDPQRRITWREAYAAENAVRRFLKAPRAD